MERRLPRPRRAAQQTRCTPASCTHHGMHQGPSRCTSAAPAPQLAPPAGAKHQRRRPPVEGDASSSSELPARSERAHQPLRDVLAREARGGAPLQARRVRSFELAMLRPYRPGSDAASRHAAALALQPRRGVEKRGAVAVSPADAAAATPAAPTILEVATGAWIVMPQRLWRCGHRQRLAPQALRDGAGLGPHTRLESGHVHLCTAGGQRAELVAQQQQQHSNQRGGVGRRVSGHVGRVLLLCCCY